MDADRLVGLDNLIARREKAAEDEAGSSPPPSSSPPARLFNHCRTMLPPILRSPFMTALLMLGGAVLTSSDWGSDPVYNIPHLPIGTFYPAVIFAAVLSGGSAAWTVCVGAVLVQALAIPPTWSLGIGEPFMLFFLRFAASLALTAWGSSWLNGRRGTRSITSDTATDGELKVNQPSVPHAALQWTGYLQSST